MKLSWKDCAKIGASIFALYLCIHFWPKALTAVKGGGDGIALFFQIHLQKIGNILVVFNNQNRNSHKCVLLSVVSLPGAQRNGWFSMQIPMSDKLKNFFFYYYSRKMPLSVNKL